MTRGCVARADTSAPARAEQGACNVLKCILRKVAIACMPASCRQQLVNRWEARAQTRAVAIGATDWCKLIDHAAAVSIVAPAVAAPMAASACSMSDAQTARVPEVIRTNGNFPSLKQQKTKRSGPRLGPGPRRRYPGLTVPGGQ